MLEEALRVFNFKEVVTTKELDKRYNEYLEKNYEENFPYNREVGSMNIRLYEWSYQVILPFSMALNLKKEDVSLDNLKVLCLLKYLRVSFEEALNNYNFDQVLGYNGSFLEWVLNEIIKKEIIPISKVDKAILAEYYGLLESKKSLKRVK